MDYRMPHNKCRDYSGYGLSQWDTTLQCYVVSHCLSPYQEWKFEYESFMDKCTTVVQVAIYISELYLIYIMQYYAHYTSITFYEIPISYKDHFRDSRSRKMKWIVLNILRKCIYHICAQANLITPGYIHIDNRTGHCMLCIKIISFSIC